MVGSRKENFHRAHNNRQKGVEKVRVRCKWGIERWSTLREDRLVEGKPGFSPLFEFQKIEIERS
jgi:hypothetical protein